MNFLREIALDLRAGRVEAVLTRYSDILLAGFILSIVGMMLIPLPTALLDILLTANITIAATILMVSLYVQDATRIASFPTILLITTLFRLGLNVSTTRLILLQADAGEVVRAFGAFVAGGNIVVGVVIFLILTIIQFVVITKGAERVAEVSARFTLDALPGKQMSIDADLRAGLLDIHEARRRRNTLQRESQLYGAMDGAMKFVKGDAIASIIITIINILGGLTIGTLQRGMEAGKAAQTYSLLTIGDGLVGQIPALLISVAAGIVVTRVASEEAESHLGKDIGEQILAQPKAIAIVAAMLCGLGLVPGLPTIPFLALAVISGAISYGLFRTRAQEEEAAANELGTETEELTDEPGYSLAVPVTLEISDELVSVLQDPAWEMDASGDSPKPATASADRNPWHVLTDRILELRNSLYYDLGVLFPRVQIRRGGSSDEGAFTIYLKSAPVYQGNLPLDKTLVDEAAENIQVLQLEAEATVHPVSGRPAAWIPTTQLNRAKDAGVRPIDPNSALALHVAGFYRSYAAEFLGLHETQTLLDNLRETHASVVDEIVPKIVNLFQVTEVLQRLVRESVSIRDFKTVMESIGEAGRALGDLAHGADALQLAEQVRSHLSRQICYRYASPEGKLMIYTVEAEIQQAISESIRSTTTGNYLGMSPDMRSDIMEAIRRELSDRPATAQTAVVLAEPEVRPYLRSLIHLEFPQAAVLSTAELAPELSLQPVGMVSLSGQGLFA